MSETQSVIAKPPAIVEIYTDGACSGNPGVGGYAAVLLAGKHQKEIFGASGATTNNRMELTAVIEGLRELKRPCAVKLYSDSAYVVNAFNNGWLDNWQRGGWKNAAGSPVSNKDLWQELLTVAKPHQITWIKVKGHADNIYNNRCDELAVRAVKEYKASHPDV